MGWKYWYVDDAGATAEIVARVQIGGTENQGTDGLVMNAADASVGTSKVVIDDPTGDFSANGHRHFWVTETECAGDDYGGYIYDGYIATQVISRQREFVANGRTWELDLVDVNTLLDRRIMVGADCNRPAETDVARMTWLLSTTEASYIDDKATFFNSDGPVDMDAVDYRGQNFRQVADDCMQQSEKTCFLLRLAAGVAIWYGPHGTDAFESDTKISNDPADIDDMTVLAEAARTTMSRDPSRVYSGIYMAFANSYVYVQRASTATHFATRDTSSPVPNVKTAAKAKARANRQLTKISTQEISISTAVTVTRAQTNDIVAGQRVQFKATHLPGFEDFLWCRVLNRTVRELGPGTIELAMDLTPDEPVPDEVGGGGGGSGEGGGGPDAVFGILRRSAGPYPQAAVSWQFPGDAPTTPGYPIQPTVGLIEAILPGAPVNAAYPWSGFLIGGTGTIDVTLFLTVAGVRLRALDYTIVAAITKNGTAVATTEVAVETDADGGFAFYASAITVDIAALPVVPDDVIAATLTWHGGDFPYFQTPWATGQNGERLQITGGSLT